MINFYRLIKVCEESLQAYKILIEMDSLESRRPVPVFQMDTNIKQYSFGSSKTLITLVTHYLHMHYHFEFSITENCAST